MNKWLKQMKKLLLVALAMVMTVGFSFVPASNSKAADKLVYSYITDFPTSQNQNGWFINCGASAASYNGGSWTNGDTHQNPSVFTSNKLVTCDKGGVSYIQFKAPRSGSVQIVFSASVSGNNDGGLFGILLCDPKRGNAAEPDKTSAEPIYPYGITGWFENDRYELTDGESLYVEEYVDVDEGDFIHFCFAGKNEQWTFNLNKMEIVYEDDGSSSSDSSSGDSTTTPSDSTDSSTTTGQPDASTSTDGTDKAEDADKTEDADNAEDADKTEDANKTDGTVNKTDKTDSSGKKQEDKATQSTSGAEFEINYTPFIIMGAGLVVLFVAIVLVFIICHKKGLI